MTIHDIKKYIESHLRTYLTDDFGFHTYNAPHTVYSVSNELDDVLLTLRPPAVVLWHVCLSRLKRSKVPEEAVTFTMRYEDARAHLSRNIYYRSLKELLDARLLFRTEHRDVYIVNVSYANKLFKPKFDM